MTQTKKRFNRRWLAGILILFLFMDFVFGEYGITAKAASGAEQTVVVLAAGSTKAVNIQEILEYSSITPAQEKTEKDIAYITEQGDVCGVKAGTVDLKVNVDGRVLTIKVIVTDPKISSKSDTIIRGQSKTIELTGIDEKKSDVTYISSDETLMTVSDTGVVTAVKEGKVQITVVADGRELAVTYLIEPEIPSNAGKKAAKKAIAISKTKTKYSQTRRMEKQYYDCSSLVSRIYRLYKVYFGVESGWAPTAAEIGKWCVSNDKVIATTGLSYKKLKPGDLVFYSYTENGRFLNISHIEIYVGDGKSVSASSSKNKVVHYAYKKASVVLIARPTK